MSEDIKNVQIQNEHQPRYWVFIHGLIDRNYPEIIRKAFRLNSGIMQYEYGIQAAQHVTMRWEKAMEVKEGDIIFLCSSNRIYAVGKAIRPRKKADKTMPYSSIKGKEIYNSKHCNTVIHFEEKSCVFYLDLTEGPEQWGQRIDVDSWKFYNKNGIEFTDNDLDTNYYPLQPYKTVWPLKSQEGEMYLKKLEDDFMNDDILNLLINAKNIILHGAPGTGKTYEAKQKAIKFIFKKESYELLSDEEKQEYKDRISFVQFHPSYDYTDFVEGLRPIKTEDSKEIGFERMDGVFKKFCKKAQGKNEKYVFIIDEINRGEMSKIFGELFFSIDPGYRGKKGKISTQYQNLVDKKDVFYDGFYVPENVYIIGTMNDIDRNVESMDFAIRRRFAFMEITATETQGMLDNSESWNGNKPEAPFVNGKTVIDRMKNRMNNLNNAIWKENKGIEGLSSAYHIGAAYFLKYDSKSTKPFEDLWNYHLKPLLQEYLRGMEGADKKLSDLETAYKDEEDHK